MSKKIQIELEESGALNVRWTKEIENPVLLRGLLELAGDTVKEFFEKKAQGGGSDLVVPSPTLKFPSLNGG